ncbi:YcjF family protein [Maritimibacter sp. 55A14]|uniref:YcjF family protein n=1 Tax=Maritimibacter sp. 55A14 TaxID=2174844 RepID=UPI001E413967|nr:TIGR01620 family protein [Maritimibacter sp. 55A14]
MSRSPVLIELDEDAPAAETPATAAPVPDRDAAAAPEGRGMRAMAALTARRGSPLVRWLWRAGGALLLFILTVAAWDFVDGLMARNIWLGRAALGLCLAVLALALGLALREWMALARLRRLDGLRRAAEAARAGGVLAEARAVTARLSVLYDGRPDLAEARARVKTRGEELLDADALLDLAEAELLAPLDAQARLEVEAAARQVATITAIVPLALADVVAALTANLRMVRRLAEIYGGRAGLFGSWRVMRAVLTHLVATGAVAVGDDLIGSVAGGGLVSKISRRFGEGVVNGALTARVGIAAMEVCRPLPFRAAPRPRVTSLVQRALTGLFDRS